MTTQVDKLVKRLHAGAEAIRTEEMATPIMVCIRDIVLECACVLEYQGAEINRLRRDEK